MKLLILGGTRFLGRHIVEQLAQRGDRVVCFHRGESTCELPDGVEERLGDRNTDLGSVSGEAWDAIVDTSGYKPEQLERSLELRATRYIFVSSVNAYADLSVSGITEDAPAIETFDPLDEALSYGGNKAACERLVLAEYPERSIILRPGLIVGRWDPTGRFTYWCERLLRGGRVLAPGAPQRRVQFVDAADVARFTAHLLRSEIDGTFNITGPAKPLTMEELLLASASASAERGAPPATLVWASDAFLHENGVGEWMEMPLWLTDAEYAGILELRIDKALSAGLTLRPIAETLHSILDWLAEARDVKRAGMAADREAELLAKL